MLVALIAEAALRNNVGGCKVMHEQLVHLAEMADQNNVIVQVIPAKASVCAGFTGPFVIANFGGGNEMAYLDNAMSGEVFEDAENVAKMRHMFDTFRSETLSRSETTIFLRKVAEEWLEQ